MEEPKEDKMPVVPNPQFAAPPVSADRFNESVNRLVKNPVHDVMRSLLALQTQKNFGFDSSQSLPFLTTTGARPSLKPFIIGLIPPDQDSDFVPVEKLYNIISSLGGDKNKGAVSSAVTSNGVPFTGKHPGELVKTQTKFTSAALGHAIYNSLRKNGISDAQARTLTPLMVGHATAEIRYRRENGILTFDTNCFNIGNIHAGGAGSFKDRKGPNDESNWSKAPTPPKGGNFYLGIDTLDNTGSTSYPTYFQAAATLEEGANTFVTGVLNWAAVKTATNGREYAESLRPDIYKEKAINYSGAYFGVKYSDPEKNEVLVSNYGKIVGMGASSYRSLNLDPSKPVEGGVTIIGEQVSASDSAKKDPKVAAMIMGYGQSTTRNEDDPLKNALGRNIRADSSRRDVVDRQIKELNRQLQSIRSTPPLIMMVNPSEFTRNFEHNIDSVKVRRGHQTHMWLEKPITISCKGQTAAQYVVNSSLSGGLTSVNRTSSISYRNFLSLITLYRNNGHVYAGSASGVGNDGLMLIPLSVYIYYDGHIYVGSFDDFSVTDDATKPYNMSYSFKFTVRYEFDVSTISDSEISASTAR